MSVRLVVEHAPHPQPERERVIESGDLIIGRGADADWRLEDPEMYISRTHCIVSVGEDETVVRDASRGGLFVDGAAQPLGAGRSIALEDGMRLRLGDIVLRVELDAARRTAETAAPEPAASKSAGPDRDAFSWDWPTEPEAATPPRPADLPTPFEDRPEPEAGSSPRDTGGFHLDDPFTLEDLPPPHDEQTPRAGPSGEAGLEEFDWSFGQPAEAREDASGAKPRPRAVERPPRPPRRPPPDPEVTTSAEQPAAEAPQAGEDPVAAFYRALGVTPPADADAAEMAAMGARFRHLAEGLVRLLRTRAQEKQSVRVAQTIIGSTEVNPLKFAASADDAVQSLVQARGPGYLDPDAAIVASYRDLADHQLRTWTALQSALRRMIDRFDPDAIEAEVEDAGLLQSLLAGGRSARLWQLYRDRYRGIAKAAEDRFLGEIGADFRDAYEGRKDE